MVNAINETNFPFLPLKINVYLKKRQEKVDCAQAYLKGESWRGR